MKVEVADLASPSLISLTVRVDAKHHERRRRLSESSVPQAFVSFSLLMTYPTLATRGKVDLQQLLGWRGM